VLIRKPEQDRWTRRIDRVLLHRLWGTLVFLAIVTVFFQVIFSWAVPLQDLVSAFFNWLGDASAAVIPAGFLADLVNDGIIAGVGTVLQFLPQIMLLFLMIALMESIGYMSRAAFVMDRLMGRIGLEGRCFVSMLSSYACAVPGIMSTRAIPSSRDRIATILVLPLMTCSARLPVYTLFIAAFVPAESVLGPLGLQGLVMLGLYLLGSVSAFLIAALLKATRVKEVSLPFYMEMPPYRWPTVGEVAKTTWDSAKYFVRKAGTIILGTSIVLFILLNVPQVTPPPNLDPAEARAYEMSRSAAGTVGRAVEPVFEPLGFDWRVNVALIGSLSAREVFVSTLGQIEAATSDQDLDGALHDTVNPATGQKTFTPPTVAALLVFFVYALQCMSTVAVMRRETNSWVWPAVAWSYMFALAWTMGFLAHELTQLATT